MANFTKLNTFMLLLAGISAAPALAEDNLNARLEAFKRDTKAYLEHIPEKRTASGNIRARRLLVSDSATTALADKRTKKRKKLILGSIKGSDRPEDLVDNADTMLTTLEEMEKKGVTEGEVKVQPWSSSYWPLYNGQIAFRYADPNFPADSKSWNVKNKYLTGEGATIKNINQLSPAEKYDLLVGDADQSLTHSALATGEQYFNDTGKVETWMGICDGWSPASYKVSRPANAVEVNSADGRSTITFYPDDIKALASLLWAENSPSVNFIGGRCDSKKPETDENGRILDQDCFDTNPGTWHQVIVNQVGIMKRPFVMDSAFDIEVWNQPLQSYSYTYFNPSTLKKAKSLENATVAIEDMAADKFAKYRPKKARFLVGISMKVDYMDETNPSTAKTDSPKKDSITEVSYEYDLELDKDMNIIGGEWYENAHPDFLWNPKPGQTALTDADEKLGAAADKRWGGSTPLPREWAEVAIGASQEGSPLAAIVKALVKLSNSSN
jgi:hypothetical protein